jgi:hypothetical protein
MSICYLLSSNVLIMRNIEEKVLTTGNMFYKKNCSIANKSVR